MMRRLLLAALLLAAGCGGAITPIASLTVPLPMSAETPASSASECGGGTKWDEEHQECLPLGPYCGPNHEWDGHRCAPIPGPRCPPGQDRDENGNCVEAPCPPGRTRNPETGHCDSPLFRGGRP